VQAADEPGEAGDEHFFGAAADGAGCGGAASALCGAFASAREDSPGPGALERLHVGEIL